MRGCWHLARFQVTGWCEECPTQLLKRLVLLLEPCFISCVAQLSVAPWAAADGTVTYRCSLSHHVLLGPIVIPWGRVGISGQVKIPIEVATLGERGHLVKRVTW